MLSAVDCVGPGAAVMNSEPHFGRQMKFEFVPVFFMAGSPLPMGSSSARVISLSRAPQVNELPVRGNCSSMMFAAVAACCALLRLFRFLPSFWSLPAPPAAKWNFPSPAFSSHRIQPLFVSALRGPPRPGFVAAGGADGARAGNFGLGTEQRRKTPAPESMECNRSCNACFASPRLRSLPVELARIDFRRGPAIPACDDRSIEKCGWPKCSSGNGSSSIMLGALRLNATSATGVQF